MLVCGRCSRRIGGGFGEIGDERLDKALRRALHEKKGRKARIAFIKSPCLEICPKKAVVAVSSAMPGRRYVIPAGTPLDQVVELLQLH